MSFERSMLYMEGSVDRAKAQWWNRKETVTDSPENVGRLGPMARCSRQVDTRAADPVEAPGVSPARDTSPRMEG